MTTAVMMYVRDKDGVVSMLAPVTALIPQEVFGRSAVVLTQEDADALIAWLQMAKEWKP